MIISSPQVHNFTYDGMTFHTYHADKGQGKEKHEHTFNHATLCLLGSCVVRVKDKEIILTKNSQPLDLPANIPHEIEALEDGTIFVNLFAEGKY